MNNFKKNKRAIWVLLLPVAICFSNLYASQHFTNTNPYNNPLFNAPNQQNGNFQGTQIANQNLTNNVPLGLPISQQLYSNNQFSQILSTNPPPSQSFPQINNSGTMFNQNLTNNVPLGLPVPQQRHLNNQLPQSGLTNPIPPQSFPQMNNSGIMFNQNLTNNAPLGLPVPQQPDLNNQLPQSIPTNPPPSQSFPQINNSGTMFNQNLTNNANLNFPVPQPLYSNNQFPQSVPTNSLPRQSLSQINNSGTMFNQNLTNNANLNFPVPQPLYSNNQLPQSVLTNPLPQQSLSQINNSGTMFNQNLTNNANLTFPVPQQRHLNNQFPQSGPTNPIPPQSFSQMNNGGNLGLQNNFATTSNIPVPPQVNNWNNSQSDLSVNSLPCQQINNQAPQTSLPNITHGASTGSVFNITVPNPQNFDNGSNTQHRLSSSSQSNGKYLININLVIEKPTATGPIQTDSQISRQDNVPVNNQLQQRQHQVNQSLNNQLNTSNSRNLPPEPQPAPPINLQNNNSSHLNSRVNRSSNNLRSARRPRRAPLQQRLNGNGNNVNNPSNTSSNEHAIPLRLQSSNNNNSNNPPNTSNSMSSPPESQPAPPINPPSSNNSYRQVRQQNSQIKREDNDRGNSNRRVNRSSNNSHSALRPRRAPLRQQPNNSNSNNFPNISNRYAISPSPQPSDNKNLNGLDFLVLTSSRKKNHFLNDNNNSNSPPNTSNIRRVRQQNFHIKRKHNGYYNSNSQQSLYRKKSANTYKNHPNRNGIANKNSINHRQRQRQHNISLIQSQNLLRNKRKNIENKRKNIEVEWENINKEYKDVQQKVSNLVEQRNQSLNQNNKESKNVHNKDVKNDHSAFKNNPKPKIENEEQKSEVPQDKNEQKNAKKQNLDRNSPPPFSKNNNKCKQKKMDRKNLGSRGVKKNSPAKKNKMVQKRNNNKAKSKNKPKYKVKKQQRHMKSKNSSNKKSSTSATMLDKWKKLQEDLINACKKNELGRLKQIINQNSQHKIDLLHLKLLNKLLAFCLQNNSIKTFAWLLKEYPMKDQQNNLFRLADTNQKKQNNKIVKRRFEGNLSKQDEEILELLLQFYAQDRELLVRHILENGNLNLLTNIYEVYETLLSSYSLSLIWVARSGNLKIFDAVLEKLKKELRGQYHRQSNKEDEEKEEEEESIKRHIEKELKKYIDAKDSDGQTLLLATAWGGGKALFEEVLKRFGLRHLKDTDMYKRGVLHYVALGDDNIELFKHLMIKYRKKENEDVNPENIKFKNLALYIVAHGTVEVFKLLHEYGMKIDACSESGLNIFLEACRFGNEKLVAHLMAKHGHLIEAKDIKGNNFLHYLLLSKNPNLFFKYAKNEDYKQFLESVDDFGQTLIFSVAMLGNTQFLEIFKRDFGFKVNCKNSAQQNLLYAVIQSKQITDKASICFIRYAMKSHGLKLQQEHFICAAQWGQFKRAEMLPQKEKCQLDIEIKDADGKNIRYWMSYYGKENLLKEHIALEHLQKYDFLLPHAARLQTRTLFRHYLTLGAKKTPEAFMARSTSSMLNFLLNRKDNHQEHSKHSNQHIEEEWGEDRDIRTATNLKDLRDKDKNNLILSVIKNSNEKRPGHYSTC